MDNVKIGSLIYKLRKEHGMTQVQLAEKLNVSDKAVSKWERGIGCPDISLLPDLSDIFKVDLEHLLTGELGSGNIFGGNMKKSKFYVCPGCGNIIHAEADASVSCCGKKLSPLNAKKSSDEEMLSVEIIDNDYFITSQHEMEKSHYISFVALLTGDTIMLRRQYPEWGLQVRIPAFAHGQLLWYCTKHGLFYQNI